jgi:hypothetical protein
MPFRALDSEFGYLQRGLAAHVPVMCPELVFGTGSLLEDPWISVLERTPRYARGGGPSPLAFSNARLTDRRAGQ